VKFFKTGKNPVPHTDTLRIMAIRSAVLAAMKQPGQWVQVVK
jgi:hypothetical protein